MSANGQIIPFEQNYKNFGGLLQRMGPQFKNALPRHIRSEQFIRTVMTTVRKTPDLLQCTQESVIGSIITSAQLGLEPDGVLGEAYLVRYGRECQLIVGYQGFIKLAWQSGMIDDIYAEIAYANDHFRYHLGTNRRIVHRPLETGDRGAPIYVYGVAKIRGGGTPFVVLPIAEVEKIRQRSRAKNGPWVTDYDAMVRKTAIRQLQKWIPKSKEQARAATLDELADANLSQDMASVIDLPTQPEPPAQPSGPPKTLDELAKSTGTGAAPAPAAPAQAASDGPPADHPAAATNDPPAERGDEPTAAEYAAAENAPTEAPKAPTGRRR